MFVDTGERGRSLREKMNLHNNEAGRMVSSVYDKLTIRTLVLFVVYTVPVQNQPSSNLTWK